TSTPCRSSSLITTSDPVIRTSIDRSGLERKKNPAEAFGGVQCEKLTTGAAQPARPLRVMARTRLARRASWIIGRDYTGAGRRCQASEPTTPARGRYVTNEPRGGPRPDHNRDTSVSSWRSGH